MFLCTPKCSTQLYSDKCHPNQVVLSISLFHCKFYTVKYKLKPCQKYDPSVTILIILLTVNQWVERTHLICENCSFTYSAIDIEQFATPLSRWSTAFSLVSTVMKDYIGFTFYLTFTTSYNQCKTKVSHSLVRCILPCLHFLLKLFCLHSLIAKGKMAAGHSIKKSLSN